jgi:hypothetical protein
VLARERDGAGMMLFDAICYGGQLAEYRDAKSYITRVIEAFPPDIRADYDREIRKTKADQLRRQADEIEKTTP